MNLCRWNRITQQKRAARASKIYPEIKLTDDPAYPGNNNVYEFPDGYDLLKNWIIDGMVHNLDYPFYSGISFVVQYWNDPQLYYLSCFDPQWFSGKSTVRPQDFIDQKAYALVRPAKKITLLLSGVVILISHYKKGELEEREIAYVRTV